MAGEVPIYKQLYELMKDGKPHHRDEIHSYCGPSSPRAISTHIHVIRRKLLKENEALLCVITERRVHYQLVYLYAPLRSFVEELDTEAHVFQKSKQ